MRIGIIAHLKHRIAEPFAGGLEMHTHLLARRLRARGHDVTLFASTYSDPAIGLEAICGETALLDVGTSEATDVAFFREHHAYLALMNRLRRSDFDLIHNNALHYLPVAMADTLPMPMVTTLHTPPFCWLESGIRECCSETAVFVGVSESVREAWAHVTRVGSVILNGIDLDRFAFTPVARSPAYLVWYGRIVPEKGLHLALDAAAEVGLEIKVAGPVSDQAYFDEKIAPRLGESVDFLGHLDHQELASVIGSASAFLCTPCWEEPYGLVVAEALACGVPVAAFARGAIPEILDPGCGVLAEPGNVASLAQAIRSALGLDRTACRRRAETLCDVEVMMDGYEALYSQLVSEHAVKGLQIRSVSDPVPPSIPMSHRSLSHGQDNSLVA